MQYIDIQQYIRKSVVDATKESKENFVSGINDDE
jgi:hypothetical protein